MEFLVDGVEVDHGIYGELSRELEEEGVVADDGLVRAEALWDARPGFGAEDLAVVGAAEKFRRSEAVRALLGSDVPAVGRGVEGGRASGVRGVEDGTFALGLG